MILRYANPSELPGERTPSTNGVWKWHAYECSGCQYCRTAWL